MFSSSPDFEDSSILQIQSASGRTSMSVIANHSPLDFSVQPYVQQTNQVFLEKCSYQLVLDHFSTTSLPPSEEPSSTRITSSGECVCATNDSTSINPIDTVSDTNRYRDKCQSLTSNLERSVLHCSLDSNVVILKTTPLFGCPYTTFVPSGASKCITIELGLLPLYFDTRSLVIVKCGGNGLE